MAEDLCSIERNQFTIARELAVTRFDLARENRGFEAAISSSGGTQRTVGNYVTRTRARGQDRLNRIGTEKSRSWFTSAAISDKRL
jgi:hypothetical protein